MLRASLRPVLYLAVVAFALGRGLPAASPQAAQPKAPDKFKVQVRYRINAPRDQHVAQYDAMIQHLKKLDFQFVPPLDELPEANREDRSKNLIGGAVSPANALKLL